MSTSDPTARDNQRQRTRKDLLRAAARLMSEGRAPSLEEVAAAALVSRATAYRHFPNIESLMVEAPIEVAMPDPEALFRSSSTDNPVTRMERVDAAVQDVIAANEPALRMMLSLALQQRVKNADQAIPARQNRRTPLIEAALEPAEPQFSPGARAMLTKALALVIGPESMVVFKDVLQIDEAEARKVRRWMIRALIGAAMRSRTGP
jgi:AcrR family transcriptional regulator